MKVFLLKDIDQVGFAGEIIKVKDGYACNFLLPKKMAVQITTANEEFYSSKVKTVDDRKAALESKSSMLAEKINNLKLSLSCKAHDDNELYGSVGQVDIAKLLAGESVKVSKNQVILDKPIKKTGNFEIEIKLSNKIKATFKLKVTGEKTAKS